MGNGADRKVTNVKDLDVLVAEKVMGWRLKMVGAATPMEGWVSDACTEHFVCEWHPSTDIKQAMEVVEKIRGTWGMNVFDGGDSWTVEMNHDELGSVSESAPTLPEAICRAALKAIEVKG